MTTFKCNCGDIDCETSVSTELGGLMLSDKSGHETLMYMDANSIVDLIVELRRILMELTVRGL